METITIENKNIDPPKEFKVKIYFIVTYQQEETDNEGSVYYIKHEYLSFRETDITNLEYAEDEIQDINDEKFSVELLYVIDELNEIIKKYKEGG